MSSTAIATPEVAKFNMPPATPRDQAQALVARGYRTVSRTYRVVARIDRPDWARTFGVAHLMAWPARAEDQYRRCHTKDNLVVNLSVLAFIPNSSRAVTGYIP